MSVPPRSLTPARSAAATPSGPAFTHETWTFVIHGCSASRPTACMSRNSPNVGPRRASPFRYIGASMCTNGSGTNSVKPPLALLLLAHAQQVPRPVHGAVDVAEHDRVVRAEAEPVRRVVHLEPLVGRHLVGADDAPHLVVEHLRGRSRQRGEALVAQPLQVVGERQAERRRALPDLERRERVHVDARHRVLDRPHDREVVVAVERRVDAALQADLDGAALPGLLDAPHDLVHAAGDTPARAGSRRASPSRTRRSRT